MCATSEWSRWSECSTTCGKGFKSRTRRFFNRMGRKKCPHVETMEKSHCAGDTAVCPEYQGGPNGPNDPENDPHCGVTSWSEWSPCSVSCGENIPNPMLCFTIFDLFQYSSSITIKAPNSSQYCAQSSKRFIILSLQAPSLRSSYWSRREKKSITTSSLLGKWENRFSMIELGQKSKNMDERGRGHVTLGLQVKKQFEYGCDFQFYFPGKGLKVRTRLYKISPQQQTNADCNVQLMEKASCDGSRSACEFSLDDARLICGLPKEVTWMP